MTLFEGTYKLKRHLTEFASCWICTLTFDELEVEVRAKTRRGSVRRATRAMNNAVKLRSTIRGIKGLCDGD